MMSDGFSTITATASGTSTDPMEFEGRDEVEFSVVIPCRNEAETLGRVVARAVAAVRATGRPGEVVVADNGSTDESARVAQQHGARVVSVAEPGYGSALMGGIRAARGRWVIMGDADGSHDFAEIPRFLTALDAGNDLVAGCRMPAGGGTVAPGAMSFLHRWVGNPLFTRLARTWFRVPVHDIHCGMRAFDRARWMELEQRCTGMEFASEMIVKAGLRRMRIAEVGITMLPDERTLHGAHLRTFRDGWRHLRFFLLFSPRWLFLIPGFMLMLIGVGGSLLSLRSTIVFGIGFDIHALLLSCLALICGYQAVLFAVFTKVFAIGEGLLPEDSRLSRLYRHVTLERGVLAGLVAAAVGTMLISGAIMQLIDVRPRTPEYAVTMRWIIPGVTLLTLGVQTILSSFFLSILGLRRR